MLQELGIYPESVESYIQIPLNEIESHHPITSPVGQVNLPFESNNELNLGAQ